MSAQQFRKKPVEIEAIQYRADITPPGVNEVWLRPDEFIRDAATTVCRGRACAGGHRYRDRATALLAAQCARSEGYETQVKELS